MKNDHNCISMFKKLISLQGFHTPVSPCWLQDDVLDFFVFTLLGEKSHIGKQFSYVASYFSDMLFSKLLPDLIPVKNTKLFTTDLVFVPLNISKVHWVLAVIVNPCLLSS